MPSTEEIDQPDQFDANEILAGLRAEIGDLVQTNLMLKISLSRRDATIAELREKLPNTPDAEPAGSDKPKR